MTEGALRSPEIPTVDMGLPLIEEDADQNDGGIPTYSAAKFKTAQIPGINIASFGEEEKKGPATISEESEKSARI